MYLKAKPLILLVSFHQTFDLDRFLLSGYGELSNLQTKILINSGKDYGEFLPMEDSDAAKIAVENLLRIIGCFGIVEYFDESLFLISKYLQWEGRSFYYRSLNQKRLRLRGRLSFSSKHIEKIVELNKADILFYEVALKEFENTLDTTFKGLNSIDIKMFKFRQAVFMLKSKTINFWSRLP